jgi:hypothetical protein
VTTPGDGAETPGDPVVPTADAVEANYQLARKMLDSPIWLIEDSFVAARDEHDKLLRRNRFAELELRCIARQALGGGPRQPRRPCLFSPDTETEGCARR